MRFAKGDEVFAATGEKIGTVNRVVIDAKSRDVTDLVVERGALFKEEKVIPVGLVDVENEDRIMLRETNQSIDDFPDFETPHYVPIEQAGAPDENIETFYWYPPANYQFPVVGMLPSVMPNYVLRTETSIPEGRVAIAEGAQVISQDEKHIGNVEQVIANSETNRVTHFVVGKGFLLKEHKLVPANWISEVDEDKIYLSVQARIFDRLPDYRPEA